MYFVSIITSTVVFLLFVFFLMWFLPFQKPKSIHICIIFTLKYHLGTYTETLILSIALELNIKQKLSADALLGIVLRLAPYSIIIITNSTPHLLPFHHTTSVWRDARIVCQTRSCGVRCPQTTTLLLKWIFKFTLLYTLCAAYRQDGCWRRRRDHGYLATNAFCL